jgi:hypothetical protein
MALEKNLEPLRGTSPPDSAQPALIPVSSAY